MPTEPEKMYTSVRANELYDDLRGVLMKCRERGLVYSEAIAVLEMLKHSLLMEAFTE